MVHLNEEPKKERKWSLMKTQRKKKGDFNEEPKEADDELKKEKR